MSQPTGLTSPPLIAPAFLQTYDIRLQTASVANGGANTVYVSFLGKIDVPLAVTNAYVYVGTQSGNLDLAVGTLNSGTFTTAQTTGSTAVGAGNALQAIPFVFTFLPGVAYYAAFGADNATATFQRFSGNATLNDWFPLSRQKASSFPIGASLASVTTGSSFTYWIGFK